MADDVADGQPGAVLDLAGDIVESVNEYFVPMRKRREEYSRDMGQ